MIAKGIRSDRRRKQRRKVFSWLMVLCMVLTMFTPQFASAEAGQVPAHSKTIHDNGDGTYNLELSVTGDADDETQEAGKVNIVVIYDTSSSMTSNAQGSNYTRADQAEDVVHDFLTNLATYQNDARDNINVALVTFARTSNNQGSGWTTDVTGIANRFDDGGTDRQTSRNYSGTAANGTNWESAIDAAVERVRSAPGGADVPTFVIMMTDGACTASGNGNNAINPSGASIGQLRPFYTAATDEAYALAQACEATGGTFYGIYAYGTEADLLDDLMYFSENNQHRGGNINNVVAATQDAPNFFRAADTSALNTAITEIFNEVVNSLGISSVSISDGTTNQVTTGTGVSELLEVDGSSYKYWISIPVVNNQFTRKMNVVEDGVSRVETVTYTVTDNGDGTCRVNWTEGGSAKSVTVSGSVSSGNFKYQWTASNDLYKYNPPAARLVNGSVEWNLSSVGTLLDGVTYSVTFDVYPSQETLDDVADIKNNPGPNGAWKDLDPAVQQYIDVNGNLKTNTTATLTYSDTRLDNPGPKTSTYTNPDPVKNSAVEQMAVTKEWDNALTEEWKKPDGIVLNVTRDDDPHYTVTLTDDNDWQGSVYVSIGIMGEDGKPLKGSEGHDFTFTEPEIQGEGFKWEIDAPTVHPMLINNQPTMLIKVDKKHPAPSGAKTYEFNDATYYVGDEGVALTATNERRSSINLVKTVIGEDVPEDAVFPFTLNVTDPLAPATAPTQTEDPNHDSDYWIWISVWDKDKQNVTDAVVSGATYAGGSWYYGESGKNIVLNVKDGYSIRINNVPVGTTYTITEGNNLPTGFIFEGADIKFTDGRQPDPDWAFTGNQTSTGSVDSTNAVYTITYTNKYELRDITVEKIWDDASNQDGVRPTELALTLNGMPAGMTAPTPIIEKNGDIWTYTWKAVPKYDADGEEIAYTVTENTVPDDYTCTDTKALDGESITNSHTPELIDIPVTKVWEDKENQDQIRPDSVTVELRANGQAVIDPTTEEALSLTLNESNNWTGTFEDQPKNAGGQAITYTVIENTTDVITGTDGLGTYAFEVTGSVASGFTVTNTHTPALTKYKVTKAWVDANNQDGYRPDSVTVHLMNGDEVVDTQTLTAANKWTYEWTELPKFDGKTEIDYSVKEDPIEHYTMTSNKETKTDDGVEAVITNTHETEKTTFTATKVWVDDNDRDGLRPDSVTVQLQDKDGNKYGDPVELNAANEWTYTWENLDVYPKVDEDPDAAETDSTGQDQDNSGTEGQPAQRSVPAAEPAEGDAQTVESPAEDTEAVTPDEAVEETPVDESEAVAEPDEEVIEGPEKREARTRDGAEKIEYTVVEVVVPDGYKVSYEEVKDGDTVTGVTVTNTHTPETINIDVKKVWKDADNVDGIRPDEIKVNLKADGTVVGSKVLDEDNKWADTFKGLPKYKEGASGVAIEYTVEEVTDSVITGTDGSGTYSFEVTGSAANGFTVTNTHTPEVINIPVTKKWEDKEDMDKIRPASVTVQLLADGTAVDGKTLQLTASDSWTGTFEDLPKYKEGKTGTEIVYTIEEVKDNVITGTDAKGTYAIVGVSGSASEGFTVTNKHTPRTDVSITKVWDDADDVDSYRPTADQFKAYVELYANGVKVDAEAEVTVDSDDSNKFLVKFKDLPAFDANGNPITYTVKELIGKIENYNVVGADEVAAGGTITNKHEPDKTEVVITKTWSDMDNKYKLRPTTEEFKDSIHLMVGEEEAKDAEGKAYVPTVTVGEDGNTYIVTYSGLPKNELVDGESAAIEYSVKEDEIAGYTAEIGDITKETDEETGAVTYTIDIDNTMEFGDVRITKELLSIENLSLGNDESSDKTSFVYSVKATMEVGEKTVTVYDGYVTLDFSGTGTEFAVIENLPAGAVVEVEEVYSGASYTKQTGPDWDAEDQTVVADETINVDFSNDYNNGLTQGCAIQNEYVAEGGSWVHLTEVINNNMELQVR